ncbi:MAG: AAA family ATPase, partial [Elusimicrobia bacterium]|nr:AAA family ATPase [Elusimicrobiota bacterium]
MNSQRALTILPLAAALLLPSAAFAGAVKTGQSAAAPGVSGMTGSPLGRSAAAGPQLDTLSGGLRLTLTSSLALPAAPAPLVRDAAVSPAAAVAAAPGLGAAPLAAPAAPAEAKAQPTAMASVQTAAQDIQAPEAKAASSGLRRVFSRLFDGSGAKSAQSDAGAAVAGSESQSGSHLSRPPQTLFSAALAVWRKAGPPSEAELQVKQANGELSDVGPEKDLVEEVKVEPEAVAVELPEPIAGADKVGLQRWIVTGGVRFAALVKGGVFWVDQTGNVFLYRRAEARTLRIPVAPGKLGPVAVSEDGEYIYAVVDGRLQRWELRTKEIWAKAAKTEAVDGSNIQALEALNAQDASSKGDGVQILMDGKRLYWAKSKFVVQSEAAEQITKNGSLRSGIAPAGRSLYIEKTAAGTRVWQKPYFGSETKLEDIGSLPMDISAIVAGPTRGTYYAATSEGILEWDAKTRRYRLFAVPGLEAAGPIAAIDVDPEGRVLVAGSHSLIQAELAPAQEFLSSKAAEIRLWAQDNPMYVKDGLLHIGEFTFPIGRKAAQPRPWYQRLADRLLRRTAPAEVLDLGISEKDWQALNLPTNKRLIYDTLKGFSMSQHMLYIGETGGGKTWIAEKIAKLTNNELWMVSMNEYTRNKDLIARETFGEEGKNKTGLTASTVLRWMQEGGILLLDEMHKPLEGIAILNNILQNGEYRLPDGRVVKYDKKKSWVIGTMNPVKPPYKGEPPSGELSSRFGMTLEVKYLPADEEAALLRIFYDKVPQGVIEKLVAIANDLRKV